MIETLLEVMLWRGIPEHIRSDNGPEFVARQLRDWLRGLVPSPRYIKPGSPWEKGYCESFEGGLARCDVPLAVRQAEGWVETALTGLRWVSPFVGKRIRRYGRYSCDVDR